MNNKIRIDDDLITKFLCGEASVDEAIAIDEWLSLSKENMTHFKNMEATYSKVFGIETVDPNKEDSWKSFNSKITPKVKNIRLWYGVAAAIFICVVAIYFIQNIEISNRIVASSDTIVKKLKDNSIVTLEKGGQIILADEFGKSDRKLNLSGKASFNVIHDDKMPFIVESNGVFIEDLGTVFTVDGKPQSDTLYVVVNEGIVRLYDDQGHELIIKAGQKAWYIRSQKKIIADIETKVIKFDFKDTALKDIVTLLHESYNIKIELMPASIGECRLTTQFFDEEVATIITIITETLGFKYQYQDQAYKIIGKPCQ